MRRTKSDEVTVVDLKWVGIGLVLSVGFFFAMNMALGLHIFMGFAEESSLRTFLRFFDLNNENNLPTWFSTVILAFAAFASFYTWRVTSLRVDPLRYYWLALSIIFVYISMDENLAIHELSMEPLRERFNVGGLLYWAWVIPGAIIVVLLGAAFLPFLFRLPKTTRNLLIASGVLFVGGALFLEMLSGYFFDKHGAGIITDLLSTFEEMGEMLGTTLFIYATGTYGQKLNATPIHPELADSNSVESSQEKNDLQPTL